MVRFRKTSTSARNERLSILGRDKQPQLKGFDSSHRQMSVCYKAFFVAASLLSDLKTKYSGIFCYMLIPKTKRRVFLTLVDCSQVKL